MKNGGICHQHHRLLGSWRPGGGRWVQKTHLEWLHTWGNWEQRGRRLRLCVQTVPRTACVVLLVRLRRGILREETDTEITVWMDVRGCESLWPVSNDSGTLTKLDITEEITKRIEFTYLSPD